MEKYLFLISNETFWIKTHIKNKIDNYYIKKIDNFLKEWKN